MVKISLASGKKEVYPGAGAPGTPNVASPLNNGYPYSS